MSGTNTAFKDWWSEYQCTGSIHPVQLGMTREDIRSFFGELEDTAKGFGRRPLMGIWKFDRIEFHFGLDGRLFLIYTEDDDFNPQIIAKEPT